MPHLISESGRAITAHHSLLLINVTDVESQSEPAVPDLGPEPHPLLVEMKENLESISPSGSRRCTTTPPSGRNAPRSCSPAAC